jgi:uncharacterized SAM-binding protein YcdF (DUF218 family)
LGKLKLFFSISLLCAVLWFSRVPILTAAAKYLVSAQEPESADVIVVLGGDASGSRALKGCRLLQQGFANEAWMSGMMSFYGRAEGELAIELLGQQGCPAEKMKALKNPVDSTRDEAVLIGNAMRARGFKRYLLVTSNYHTRRSGIVFRKMNPDMQAIVIQADDRQFPEDNWWRSRANQKIFFYEWLKTVSYWVGL